ncbi:unnamed protein product [Rotaria socialis]|uniref:HMG box domain-containing protein n=1 Tax=Rotaria socialis TaxID=392032 RepID=A0A820ZYV0_9BILA|nr:unnamed protein product [Rotaria socialis]CAF4572360.1 unnamed protein product [Rotaria socialis]
MVRHSSQKGRNSKKSHKHLKGWIKFFVDKQEEAKKQNPNIMQPDIMKMIAEMWRQRDEATKLLYPIQNRKSKKASTEKSGNKEKNNKGPTSNMKQTSQQSNKENQPNELSD